MIKGVAPQKGARRSARSDLTIFSFFKPTTGLVYAAVNRFGGCSGF
ncbi:hypothetical protein J7J18_00610 [bacterium]|nr:hypothetical protein [bacterium]